MDTPMATAAQPTSGSEARMPRLTPGARIGKYRVERIIGEGAMGVVVAATNLDLDERVALKFMRAESMASPEIVQRFAREAKAAAKMKSEHVARVYDVGTHEGVPFIVMELLEGRDLDTWLHRRGPLAVRDVALFLTQACEALAEAHSRGIVHRDVKPANLFVVERGALGQAFSTTKILDFGISKMLPNGRSSAKDTRGFVGSPLYMAPEQFGGALTSPACDVWAVGVVLFELLTGQTPFDDRRGLVALMQAIATAPAPRLTALRPDAPPALEALVDACLAKDAGERPTIAEVARALAPFGPASAAVAAERATSLAGAGRASTPRSVPPPPVVVDGPRSAAALTLTSAPRRAPMAVVALFAALAAVPVGFALRAARGKARPPLAAVAADAPRNERVEPVERSTTETEVDGDPASTAAKGALPTPTPSPVAATARAKARATTSPTPATPATSPPRAFHEALEAATRTDRAAVQSINQVVRAERDRLAACVASAKAPGRDLRGRFAVAMTLDAAGRVVDASSAGSTVGDETLESCVLALTRTFRLPAPASEDGRRVTYTFVFR